MLEQITHNQDIGVMVRSARARYYGRKGGRLKAVDWWKRVLRPVDHHVANRREGASETALANHRTCTPSFETAPTAIATVVTHGKLQKNCRRRRLEKTGRLLQPLLASGPAT